MLRAVVVTVLIEGAGMNISLGPNRLPALCWLSLISVQLNGENNFVLFVTFFLVISLLGRVALSSSQLTVSLKTLFYFHNVTSRKKT